MKIACVLYGQPRSLVPGLDLLRKYIIEPNGIQDIYVHQWYSAKLIGTRFVSSQMGNDLKWGSYRKDTLELLAALHAKLIVLEQPKDFPEFSDLRMYGDTNASRLGSCFYSMQNAAVLAGTDYDCVIRVRTDIEYFHPVVVTECEADTVYVSNKYQHDIDPKRTSIKGFTYIRCTDFFMYGTPATMRTMGKVYDNLPMLSADTQDPGGEEFSGLWAGLNHLTINTFPDSFRQLRQTD